MKKICFNKFIGYGLLFTTVAIVGCSAPRKKPPSISLEMYHVLQAFDEQGFVHFPLVQPNSVLPSEWNRPISWEWKGSLYKGLQIIAKQVNYKTDLPDHNNLPDVTINQTRTTLGKVLDEMAASVADDAEIIVDIPNHIIKVKWHEQGL